MSHLNEKNLITVLQRVTENPKLAPAMRSIGASGGLIWNWLRRSAAGAPELLVHWPDEDAEPIQFVEAMKIARKMHLIAMDATIREEVDRGIPKVVIYEGKIMWQEDESLSKYTDQQIQDLYEVGGVDYPDRYKRDANGERIPLTVYESAPAALRVHAIKSLMGRTYNPSEFKETTVQQSVVVIGGSKPTSEGESDLVRDLRQRVLELEMRGGAEHPKPTLPVVTGLATKSAVGLPAMSKQFRSDDEKREGVGAGPTAEQIAAAGGYSVRR
jgi:hypothetical protein